MTAVDQLFPWPGSKRARASQLAGYFGDDARPVYCEPFFGAGSIYGCGLHQRYGSAILGDMAPRLVPTYRAVRQDPAGVIQALQAMPSTCKDAGALATANGWVAEKDAKRLGQYADPWKAYFYHHRTSLNQWVPVRGEVATPEHAAALIWHRAASFNGLVRTGPGGDNSTAGDRILLPAPRTVATFGAMLAGSLLVETDFERTVRAALSIGPADVFLDPPYAGDFSTYTAAGFNDQDRDRLALLVRDVVAGGGRVLVTEADHEAARRWLDLAGLYMREVNGRTSISRSGDQRGVKKELIARSWPW